MLSDKTGLTVSHSLNIKDFYILNNNNNNNRAVPAA